MSSSGTRKVVKFVKIWKCSPAWVMKMWMKEVIHGGCKSDPRIKAWEEMALVAKEVLEEKR